VGNSLVQAAQPGHENYEWQGEAPNTKGALDPPLEPRWSSAI
jgi:hypothetical protein